MRQRLPIASFLLPIIALTSLALADPRIQRALDLAESRYQQASREAFQAQHNREAALQAGADARANYDAALNEQRVAGRLLADAQINLPRVAEAVKTATDAVDAERNKLAPFHASVEAAAAELRRRQDTAIAPRPQWKESTDRVRAASARHQEVVDDRLALLQENEAYLGLLAELSDAEQNAFALRDTPNVAKQQLEDATLEWLAAAEAVNRFEAEVLAADPAVRASQGAVDAEIASQDVLRARLVREVGDDPAIAEAAATLSAEQGKLAGASESVRHAQATLDAHVAELKRLEGVVASARQRLAKAEQDLPALEAAIAQSDETSRRAEADLAAAQHVEQLSRADRDAIAADLAAATYVPEPVYVPEPIVIVESSSIIYCPSDCTKHHHSAHGRYRFRDHDHDRHGRDDRHDRDDHDRNRDYGRGTRRDEGDQSSRRRDEPDRPRRDSDSGNDDAKPREPGPSAPPFRGTPSQSATERRKQEEAKAAAERQRQQERPSEPPRAKAEDDSGATARRKQEEAKAAAERRQREESAAASERQRQEEASRAESRRQESESRRRQQESEASARRQQQEQERQQQQQQEQQQQRESSSSSNEDRGSRYRRR